MSMWDEYFTITEDSVTDPRGNTATIKVWGSVQKAKDSLYGMASCTNCIDCRSCSNCVRCRNSSYLEDCFQCNDCVGCRDCIDCNGCTDCRSCMGCIDCQNCKFCRCCSSCKNKTIKQQAGIYRIIGESKDDDKNEG